MDDRRYQSELLVSLTAAVPQACDVTAFTFPRGSVRDYIAVCANPRHARLVRRAFMGLYEGAWGRAGMCRLQELPYCCGGEE